MATDDPHPNLAPQLRRLSGQALNLWSDAGERRQALIDILVAWESDDAAALERTVRRADRGIRAGLAALGLRRASGKRVVLGSFGRRWIGHVTDDGMIELDVDTIHHYVSAGQPDRIFHTWVHESLHARGLSSMGRPSELPWRGYEEGLVEGLARLVVELRAGITVPDRPYEFYVAAYTTLADVLGVHVERLWRKLWRVQPGDVRQRFGECVTAIARSSRQALSAPRCAQLAAVGDRVFASSRAGDRPSVAVLTRLWESVFR